MQSRPAVAPHQEGSAVNALDLNFVGRRRPQAPGVVLLVLGCVAVAASLLDYRQVSARAEADQRAVRETARQRASLPVPRARADVRELRQELQRANTLLRQMSVPWEGLFAAVEQTAGRDVALLSLHPDVAAQQLRISGEAKSIEHALAFAQRLGASALLEDAHLTGHEAVADGAFPIAFALSARWVEP